MHVIMSATFHLVRSVFSRQVNMVAYIDQAIKLIIKKSFSSDFIHLCYYLKINVDLIIQGCYFVFKFNNPLGFKMKYNIIATLIWVSLFSILTLVYLLADHLKLN